MLGRPREDVRGQDVDGCLVRVERGLVRGRDLGGGLVLEAGRDEHPVLATVEPLVAQVADVGDVLDVEDLEAVVQQDPADEVREQVAAQVADVRVAVDRGAAGVHPDATGLDRLDRSNGAAEGIAKAQGHRAMLPGAALGAMVVVAPKGLQAVARILPPMRRPLSRAVALGLLVSLSLLGGTPGVHAADAPVRIFTGSALTLDPAAQGDVTSASITAQLFETLTTFDADLRLRPALAESWRIEDEAAAGSSSSSDRT